MKYDATQQTDPNFLIIILGEGKTYGGEQNWGMVK